MIKYGYLYVVDGLRWVREVSYAATRLRSLTEYPIAIICSERYAEIESLADFLGNIIIITVPKLKGTDFCSKVIGMQNSPFERTLYMDTDTFVVNNIDGIFNLLDFFDIGMKQEPHFHTNLFPVFDNYRNYFAEYNTGIILFSKNTQVNKLLVDWEKAILEQTYNKDYFDMPQLRNILVNEEHIVKIYGLHENYNMQGLRSYKIIHGQVSIIHERFGTFWNSHSERMLDNNKMIKIANRINSLHGKRIFIPFFNIVVSANKISLTYIVRRIKQKLGFPKIPKRLAFK